MGPHCAEREGFFTGVARKVTTAEARTIHCSDRGLGAGAADTQFGVAFRLASVGAALALFDLDVLDDLQHGVRGGRANGAMELAINVVTSPLSPFVLRPIWSFAHAPLS